MLCVVHAHFKKIMLYYFENYWRERDVLRENDFPNYLTREPTRGVTTLMGMLNC